AFKLERSTGRRGRSLKTARSRPSPTVVAATQQTSVTPAAQKPSAVTLAQMFEPIRDDLREVEREFAQHVQSQVGLIPTIGTYIQDGADKRIRPAVLLMAARMAGYTGEKAVLYATVIEFIHSA